jgi:hypothetical protein
VSAGSKQWKNKRARVFERDGGCCVICGAGLTLDYAEIHHRRFRSRGGRDELVNLITVCDPCHDSIHLDVTGLSTAAGWAVSQFGDGPAVIPVRYFDGRIVLLSNDLETAA